MPFQSEKQRRYLHANHPEIAKRWERDYGEGGIAALNAQLNQLPEYYLPAADGGQLVKAGSGRPGYGGPQDWGQEERKEGPYAPPIGPKGGGGGGPPSILNPPSGPTAAEIAVAKAKAEAEKRVLEAAARKKYLADFKGTQKEKVKQKSFIDKNWEDLKALSTVPLNVVKGAFGNPFNPEELTTATLTDAMKEDLISKAKAKGTLTGNIDFTDYGSPTKTFSGLNKFMDPIDIANALTMGGTNFTTDELGNIEFTGGKYDFNKSSNPILGFIDQGGLMGASKKLGEKIYDLTHKAAKGGVARKNYFHGGILGLNESEEIISDDGNDIELTAYNAAFDDPNDLSTGVQSLFQAKDGGTPQLVQKSKSGKRPGYGGPQDWGQQERAEQQAAETGHAGSEGTGAYAGKSQAEMQSLSQVSPSHGGMDTAWSQSPEYKDAGYKAPGFDATEKAKTAAEWKEAEIIKVLRRKDLNKKQKWNQLKYELEELNKLRKPLGNVKKAWAVHPVVGLLVGIYEGGKIKKEQEAEIASLEKKLEHLKDWELDVRHHAVDTPFQILEQRILDLQQPRTRVDEPPKKSPYVPTIQLLEEQMGDAQEDYGMSAWERIKANQARKANLVAKGIHTEYNPIVDESVTDITMTANSGGLANLFRVKNQ